MSAAAPESLSEGTEAERIAADLAYQRLKDSGELLRRETDRAHRIELNERPTNNLGLWV